jgi:rhodanese-related sulfurtransferase
MLDALKKLFGFGPRVNYKELINQGAQVIDVRTPGEFKNGHTHGAINVPLQSISHEIGKLNKEKTYITCCASGMRSRQAKNFLISKGFEHVHNGGSWASLT